MHFFGFAVSGEGGVVISDDALPNSVSATSSNFETALCGLHSVSVFSVERGKIPVVENGASYMVSAGSGSLRYRTIRTHLDRRNQCGSAICPFRTHVAGVMYPTGMRQVRHHTFRCVGKRCRACFGANYSQSRNEERRNTAKSLGDIGAALMISKRLGFSKSYMRGSLRRIKESPPPTSPIRLPIYFLWLQIDCVSELYCLWRYA